jgi:Rrf2 family transcriptional regulator, cysteine metabolism repressor
MMFSTKAEYGVRVMVHLARRDDNAPVSLSAVADAEGLPLAYLEHLVQRLRRAELVGEIAPIEGISADADGVLVCTREGTEPCPTKLLWTRVQGSIVRTLNEMTLADLVRPPLKEKEKATA